MPIFNMIETDMFVFEKGVDSRMNQNRAKKIKNFGCAENVNVI